MQRPGTARRPCAAAAAAERLGDGLAGRALSCTVKSRTGPRWLAPRRARQRACGGRAGRRALYWPPEV